MDNDDHQSIHTAQGILRHNSKNNTITAMNGHVECLLEGKSETRVFSEDGEEATECTHNLSHELTDSEDEEEEELSWRLNPKRSLSDWTVQIVIKGTNKQVVYHVHKSVLAIGPRRSNYFASAFFNQSKQPQAAGVNRYTISNGNSKQQQMYDCVSNLARRSVDYVDAASNLSRIELHSLAADAFPAVLDYLYSSTGQLAISTNNAAALHALSQHLEMKSLRRVVQKFWSSDLTMDNLCTYYQHARVFQDTKLLTFAEEFCAKHIFEISEEVVVDILTTVDPLFFLKVVSHTGGKEASLRLSLLIAVYCNIHKEELDKNMFLRLTASSHLPQLEIKAARALLEMEDDICGARNYISSLKSRSITVLSENWDTACVKDHAVTRQQQMDSIDDVRQLVDLPRLYEEPLELFTSMAFLNAKKRLEQSDRERKDLLRRNQTLERELKETRRKMEEMHVKLKKVQGKDAAATPATSI